MTPVYVRVIDVLRYFGRMPVAEALELADAPPPGYGTLASATVAEPRLYEDDYCRLGLLDVDDEGVAR